eukprot:5238245-Alexandrium_andersonii.AAC.1
MMHAIVEGVPLVRDCSAIDRLSMLRRTRNDHELVDPLVSNAEIIPAVQHHAAQALPFDRSQDRSCHSRAIVTVARVDSK